MTEHTIGGRHPKFYFEEVPVELKDEGFLTVEVDPSKPGDSCTVFYYRMVNYQQQPIEGVQPTWDGEAIGAPSGADGRSTFSAPGGT